MKNFWNLFLLSSFIISVLLTGYIYYLLSNKIYPIEYDEKQDSRELTICNKKYIPQYYSVGTDYIGGKRAVKNELLPQIKERKIEFGGRNGYVTIRFIVNCKGEIGLFRENGIDENIKSTKYSDLQITELKNIISTLSNWDVKIKNDKTYDSYYFINFKIEKGLITDIF